MIEPAQARLAESPHLMLFPCLFIAVAVLAFLLLGDGLQDVLDPREQR
jgi:ABC-type dipeptide/oligopeptide/nickel transport system permease subunit